ncbi:hypothetical protein D9M71_824960 [compost metagenome]
MLEADKDKPQLLGDFRLGRQVLWQGFGWRIDDVRQGGEHALDDQIRHDAQVGDVQMLQFRHQ